MSRVLIGSMTAVSPSAAIRSAAQRRLSTHPLALFLVPSLGPQPRHRVQQPAIGGLGVEDRLVDPVTEFLLASRQGGEAALATGPIAGNGVEQRQGQAVLFEPLGDRLGRMLVREQELDALESGARGRVEPVEKADVLEHHAEIGGEIRHGALPGLPAMRRSATLAIRQNQGKAHGRYA